MVEALGAELPRVTDLVVNWAARAGAGRSKNELKEKTSKSAGNNLMVCLLNIFIS